ncbi:MAG TPA: NAD-dependent epimerase/dehydratase family protein [Coriobacteriia bacterium]
MNDQVIAALKADCASAATDVTKLEGLRGQRILVTGGTGFMGSWVAEMVAWLNDAEGFGIDLLLLSPSASAFAVRAPHLAARKDITLIEQDVRHITRLPDGVTYVIHAAGTPDNRVHVIDPLRTMDVIAHGTSAVMHAAAVSADLRKVLNVSSGLIYGAQPLDMAGMPESHAGGPEPDSIKAIYAEAKRYAEAEAAAWRSRDKLPVVTARPFAFIGPYQGLDKPWAINNFLRDALLGVPIRILGDADTVRSYMYPSDMAFWLLAILADGVPGTAYNVGSPDAITLGKLAERIAASFDNPPSIVCRPLGQPRVTRFVPDVSRAQSTLGLRVTVDLDHAIERTLEWHRAAGAQRA